MLGFVAQSLGSMILISPALIIYFGCIFPCWSSFLPFLFQVKHLVLTLCIILHALFLCCFFFKINFFEKLFQEHNQSVKQFGSRSGLTFCQAWSASKLFAKVISRRHKISRPRVIAILEKGIMNPTIGRGTFSFWCGSHPH